MNAPRHMHWQQNGGTLLGVLLGLGLGLLIAAGVAYFVYQGGPPPFKSANNPNPPNATAATPAATATVASAAASAAAKASASAVPAAVEGKIDFSKTGPGMTPAAAPSASTPAVVPTQKASAPPVRAEPAPQATPPSAESKPLYLQAGAFSNKPEAENRRAMLGMVGLEGKISEIAKDDKPLYRVRVGPFESPESASKARADMARNGIDAVVVK